MTGVECDMCGGVVKNPDRGRTYFTVGELDLCPDCVKDFDVKVSKAMDREPYTLSSYKEAMRRTVAKFSK